VPRRRRFVVLARRGLIGIVVLVGAPAAAAAQPYIGRSTPHRGSFEISGGVVWTGGYDAGSGEAKETTAGTAPLTLFVVDGQMKSGPGAAVQVGIYLGRRVSAEAAFHYSRPILRARVTSDFESAGDVDLDGTVVSYLAGGSLLYHFSDGRIVPFVSGGGGYLRQLDEENADLLTGTEIHAGGGLKYWMGRGKRRFGLRLEALASVRSKSVAFEQKQRIVASFAAGMAYLF
jgi:hypothetical protein